MGYFLETKNLTKKYRFGTALEAVDLSVEKGSILGIVGREGAGKSTLLALLSGLLKPTGGTIRFGENADEMPRIGILLESPAFYENLTAYDNLNIKRLMAGVKTDDCIAEVLNYVGLSNWGGVKVKNFSPGMKKRLAIAMAILGEPELLLLDEPLRDLDPQSIRDIKLMIRKVNRDFGTTVIMTAETLQDLGGITTETFSLSGGNFGSGLYREDLSSELPGYIRLIADPLSEAKRVLDEMEIFGYQTKTEKMLYVLEQVDRRDEMVEKMTAAGVDVKECVVLRDAGFTNGGNGGNFR